MKKQLQLLVIILGLFTQVNAQTWTQKGNTILGGVTANYFGLAVGMDNSGNTVAVGAYGNDVNGINSGMVKVFEWDSNNWAQKGQNIYGENAGDWSGSAVSMNSDGSIVAIGSYRYLSLTGQVRIFEWNGSSWIQKGLNINGAAISDWFGFSVNMSSDGSTVVIGAKSSDLNGSLSGHTQVYSWDGSNWTQKGTDILGPAASSFSGHSVSIDANGSTVIIGEPAALGSNRGQARIFNWNGSSWVAKGSAIIGESTFNDCGTAVDISVDGNIVAIGAPGNSGTFSGAGHVRIYTWDGSAWVQKGLDIEGEAQYDESGMALSMSDDGNSIVIGAINNDVSSVSQWDEIGHARVYQWNGSSWLQSGNDFDGHDAHDSYGKSVSMNSTGNMFIVGSPFNQGGSNQEGFVKIFSSFQCSPTAGVDSQTACNTYTWIDGNTYTTSNNTATHTLTNANGCDSVVTLNLTINSLPTVTASIDQLICLNHTVNLTASGATSYNWDNGAGTGANVSVSPTVTTTYIVTGTDANGCDNTASTTVTVDPCVGLEEATNKLGINIYPNPSTGEFTIDVKTDCEVEIVNVIGEIVFKQNLISGTNAVDISTNSNGVYFIKFKTNTEVFSKRIVLNK